MALFQKIVLPPRPPDVPVNEQLERVIAVLKREFADAHPDWKDVFKACVRIELK